jgi:hypothetical protein
VLPSVDQFVGADREGHPAFGERGQQVSELVEVEHAPVHADGPRLVVLELRSRGLERTVDIPAVVGVDCGANDRDVLLRHRPPSISRRQGLARSVAALESAKPG